MWWCERWVVWIEVRNGRSHEFEMANDAELTVGTLEERRRQERLRGVRTVVGVVLLKSIRVAYTFRQCSPQRTIVSAAACVVRCDAVHRHAFPCRAGCCLKVPPNDNPLAHPPRTLTSRSGGQETPASARQLLCVHHTINFRQPLSSPQEVPQYCMPDTLAFNLSLSPSISGLHVAAPFFEACHVSHLVRESTTHVFPPRHPLLQPGTRMPKTTHGARWTPITPVLQLRETVSHASRASCLELVY